MSEPMASFEAFVKERVYLKAVSRKTVKWYWCAWKAFQVAVGDSPSQADSQITKAHLQAFVVSLRERGVKPRSVNTYLQCLNAYCRWLHLEHGQPLVRLPLLKTEKKVLRTFGDAELRLLLSFKPKRWYEWRTFALVCTLIDTGCRIDELLGLRVKDVDFEQLLLTVKGKGDKERRVPISLELRKVLWRHLKAVRGEFLFGARNGAALMQRNALRDYYILKRKVGLPHEGGFHQLRHSFATGYLRNGGDVVRLSKQLGHSNLTTTMKYEHLMTEDLTEAHQRVSPLSRLR